MFFTAVKMRSKDGDILLGRPDGLMGTLSIPGSPDRIVALKRRETAELIAEELRRLDPDDIYASAVRTGVDRLVEPVSNEPLVAQATSTGTVEAAVATPRVTAKVPLSEPAAATGKAAAKKAPATGKAPAAKKAAVEKAEAKKAAPRKATARKRSGA